MTLGKGSSLQTWVPYFKNNNVTIKGGDTHKALNTLPDPE